MCQSVLCYYGNSCPSWTFFRSCWQNWFSLSFQTSSTTRAICLQHKPPPLPTSKCRYPLRTWMSGWLQEPSRRRCQRHSSWWCGATLEPVRSLWSSESCCWGLPSRPSQGSELEWLATAEQEVMRGISVGGWLGCVWEGGYVQIGRWVAVK